MKCMQRYLGSLMLGAAFLVPFGIQVATANAQVTIQIRRYHDPVHRDWHEWNEPEARAYRHWWMEERREQRFREFKRLNRERQREYWRWRHERPDWH